MRKAVCGLLLLSLAILYATATGGADANTKAANFRLDSLDGLEAVDVKPEVATYQGRRAVQLHNSSEDKSVNTPGESLAILSGSVFKDGTVEAEIAGSHAGELRPMRGDLSVSRFASRTTASGSSASTCA